MADGMARKWSVEAFYGLLRHDLTKSKSPVELPVELIEGRIVPLPISEQLARQVERLRQQIQQALAQAGYEGFEVRSHYPIQINASSELKPTLTVLSIQQSQATIHWVMDIDKPEIDRTELDKTDQHSNLYLNPSQDLRSQLYAHHGIAEYWSLSTEQVELRTHHTLKTNDSLDDGLSAQYQHHQLQHVGEQMHPLAFPQLKMQLQEPLPLYFLTRTATGHHTYIETMLPLQLKR